MKYPIAIAAAMVAVAPALAPAEKIELKYLTAWDNRVQGTNLIGYAFGKKVEAATEGRLRL